MSGVWVFKNGVLRSLPPEEPAAAAEPGKKKALVYVPAEETVASHEALKRRLLEIGWELYDGEDPADPSLVQFRRGDNAGLISLPADFASVGAEHMHDIVVKNKEHFKVVDTTGDPAN